MKSFQKSISMMLIFLFLFTCIVPLSTLAAEDNFSTPATKPAANELIDIIDLDVDANDTNILIENTVQRKKTEKRIAITQNIDLEDYLYGHSTYYNEMKKANRLDLIKNHIEETEIMIKVEDDPEAEKQMVDKRSIGENIVDKEEAIEPTADEPTADEPVADEPTEDEPTADEPVADEPVADEPVADEPVADDTPILNDPVLDKPAADKQMPGDIIKESLIALAANAASTKEYYNTLVGPSAMNNLNNTQYSSWQDIQEIISPETGDLSLKITDISLPGRNGLNLDLARIYQSNQSSYGDKKIAGDLTYSYTDYSTYYINRYNLGMGWMFAFPSVQIEQERSTKEMYYHTGDGAVYRVKFTSNTSDSNLEKYYKKDAVFDPDTSYSNGQATSAYVFKTADKTKRYFADDGRLLGIVDRFGNEIKFEHIERAVSNRAPNNDFEYPEANQVWTTNSYYSYDNNFGKDDSTSYRFYRPSTATQSGMSKYIEAHPHTQYYLGGYINDQLTSGTASLTWQEYDYKYDLVRQGTLNSATIKNDWEHVEQYFTTRSNTRYIRLEFRNTSAQGNSWVDKIVFDQAWPLISKITDTLGREIDFAYTNTLYEEYPDENVTITISDPANSDSITYTYEKSYCYLDFTWRFTGAGNWTEERKSPDLWSFSNGVESQYYYTTLYPTGENDAEYYSFWEKTQSSRSGWMCSPLLSKVEMRNSSIYYDYAKKTNHLGTEGFIQTHRVVERYEKPRISGGWSTEKQNRQQFSYSGVSGTKTFNNESGYPHTNISPNNSSFYFTCTMQQDNGLQTEQQFRGSSIGLRKHSDRSILASGEEKARYYDTYDSTYPNQPTLIRTADITPGSGTQILYYGSTYNTWGGLASETRPLTQTEWINSTTRQKNSISYTYDPTFKFLVSKSYYQDNNTLLSSSNSYDSQGRLTSTTNEKGEITTFNYQDSSHPGNLTKTTVNLSGNKNSITEYAYNDPSNTCAYLTSLTRYYTEDGSATSSTEVNQYEYLFGNIINRQDGEGNQTVYEYDVIGRLIKVTFPPSAGENGSYTIQDNYVYSLSKFPTELGGRSAFEVYYYRSKIIGGNSSAIAKQYTYYDDHGNLLLSKRYNYETASYMVDKYAMNNYGQLTTYQDAQGNYTTWDSDAWDRLHSITDTQGNQQLYEYNNYNRTVSSRFVPQDTGIPENHHLVTYDKWGRIISQKGFPAGTGQAPIVVTHNYDLVGNLTATTDGRGNTTNYHYDQLNRLLGITDALGQNTNYQYHRLSQLEQVIQYEGQEQFITAKEYDERGLATQYSEPGGETILYRYDANGLPVQITDPSGKTTTIAYDGNRRLSQITSGDQRIDYYYHPLGGAEKYDVLGTVEDLWYDYYSTGLTKQRKLGTFQVNFAYDTLNNRTKITDPFGLAVNYQYDSLGRVSNIQADSKIFSYEHYADGMIKAVNYPNGLKTEYTYDNMNRLTSLINKRNGTALSQFSYQYDGCSNIISVNENGQVTTYQYDALNRLTGISRPGGEIITYQYDSRGNRTQMTGTGIERKNFNPGEFTYNQWDEMNSFTPAGGDAANYEYDPEGLRTKKTVSQSVTRYHCDDNGLVIAESDENNNVTAQNIWGHRPLARKINGSYYYYVYNGHGDVIQVLDESGNTVNTYQYDEWGNILSQNEQIANPIRYAGEYYDEESGLYYLRARYYDPLLGRFISKDSVEGDITNPLSLNRYAYCAGNPIIYIDPTGNTTEWDYRNVTNPQDLAFIDALGKAWQDATNQETRDFAHACAEFIRDKYRGPNEYGLKDGNTITINNKSNGIYNTGAYKWFEEQSPVVQTALAVPAAFVVAGVTLGGIVGALEVAPAVLGVRTAATIEATIYSTSSRLQPIIGSASKALPFSWELTKKKINTPPGGKPGLIGSVKMVFNTVKNKIVEYFN
jgi:RHS repeat-associated protein